MKGAKIKVSCNTNWKPTRKLQQNEDLCILDQVHTWSRCVEPGHKFTHVEWGHKFTHGVLSKIIENLHIGDMKQLLYEKP